MKIWKDSEKLFSFFGKTSMKYSIYPHIIPKIKKILKSKNFKILTKEPEFFVQKKLRFYHAICQNPNGKKFFFKSLLKRERGIKNRFLNEIKFLAKIREKKIPLAKRVPKIFDFSLSENFPFLVYEFLPGKSKKREDKFSKEEIKEAINLMKIINSTEEDFDLVPKRPIFNFLNFSQIIFSLLKRIRLKKEIETKILKFIEKMRPIFKSVKPKLTHGDFSEANLIFYKGKAKIVDWEHVHFRNPLYDFVSFWKKREKERKLIEREFFKKEKFEFRFPLFKMALIEISLKDLEFFEEMLEIAKKEKDKKGIEKREVEIKKTLKLLKTYL